jgi:DNA-binding CsgD family transcriptional regulator
MGSAGVAGRLGPDGRSGRSAQSAGELLRLGLDALAGGRWQEAARSLTEALDALPSDVGQRAEALVGVSDALWWLGEAEEALAAREDAYAVWRQRGEDAAAARAAAWLAREYAAALGNPAASQGWLARAETLSGATSDPGVAGWVALTRALLAVEPAAQADAAAAAVELARRARDSDLELLALGRLGLAQIAVGRLEDGFGALDEAMAAATAGESQRATLATLCCELVAASELSGEIERFAQWNTVIESLAARDGHPALLAFCATCCAEAFAAAGAWSDAEQQLRAALEVLQRTGHRARCVAPAAKLAELLVLQGRLEEAVQALADDDSDDTMLVRARLALARQDGASAIALAERHRRRLGGDMLLTAPALALLVEAHLTAGDRDAARAVADRLADVAASSGHRRTAGRAALVRARVAVACGDADAARTLAEEALDHLSVAAPGSLEAAEAHLQLARLHAGDAPELAAEEARAAIVAFETAGAAHGTDAAAALLRSLGDRSRVGRKDAGVLTDREQQVLRLVAQGLTNAEIAERLFISPKTAGNHVSSVLAKLGLRSRVEAAAYAALHTQD